MTKNTNKKDIDILSEMLLEENKAGRGVWRKADRTADGRLIIKLQEKEIDDLVIATICNVPSDSLVIKADKFPPLDKFFKSSKGVNKRADFIIISERTKVVLYVELKSRGKLSEVKKQLKGASCVLAYCKEAGKQFWNKDDFLRGYKHRYIGITETGIDISVSDHRPEKHDTPESYLSIPLSNDIQFKELAA